MCIKRLMSREMIAPGFFDFSLRTTWRCVLRSERFEIPYSTQGEPLQPRSARVLAVSDLNVNSSRNLQPIQGKPYQPRTRAPLVFKPHVLNESAMSVLFAAARNAVAAPIYCSIIFV